MNQVNNVVEVLNSLSDIKYGWLDIDKNIYLDESKGFKKKYVLATPEDVMNNKIGTCFDIVELERAYFKNLNMKFNTYFMAYYD